jgi:hypothetical protein
VFEFIVENGLTATTSNPINTKHVLVCMSYYLLVEIMPSVARRKQKNTQNAHLKEKEREKEAKKKLERQQLPEKGKKR